MNIQDLPPEILENIAQCFGQYRHLSFLTRASHQLHRQLTPYLYRRNSHHWACDDDVILLDCSVMQWAVRRGRLDPILRALDVGILIRDDPGLLSFAVESGNLAIIELILAADGVKIDERGDRQRTALSWAIKKGNVKVTRLLLEHGADVNNPDSCLLTPLHQAIKLRGDKVAGFLSRLYQQGQEDLLEGHYGVGPGLGQDFPVGPDDLARLLLEHGANVEGAPTRKLTPLHTAAHHGDVAGIGLLLDAGANIEARSPERNTPLQEAVLWSKTAAVKLLLERGADVAARTGRDETLLCMATDESSQEIIDILLQHGARSE